MTDTNKLRCPACGGTDLEWIDGPYRCRACKARWSEALLVNLRSELRRAHDEVGELRKALPQTMDGIACYPGVTVYCPNGHMHIYHPSDSMSGIIYCLKGECYSSGCQGDGGSGTYYDAKQCRAALAKGGE